MKRIVFTCCILAASCSLALAQTATINPAGGSQEQQIAPKLLFSSKINQYYANALRNKTEVAQKAYNEAVVMMQTHIAKNTQALGANAELVQQQQTILSDLTPLASDVMKNREAIKLKLTAFMNTI